MRKNTLIEPGTFTVGCNYWASHAGTRMWADWNAAVVEDDLKQLADAGLETLRVFPLWPDFQPLVQTYGGGGNPHDLRFGEEPLPDTSAGKAGVSEDALAHFEILADVADVCGLDLIVGLVTGWMSGRLYVPPAFERLNVLTDPLVRRWTIRFVRHFVASMKDKPAIHSWDLGNECNCMAPIESSDRAYEWTSAIASAIRCEDDSRKIVSGMHSLGPGSADPWRIQDQGELTDILTTHPYPIFTPHCNQEPVDTIRNAYHAAAESRLYADIGCRPCFAEEFGTLGPMVASEEVASRYLNNALCNLWAHDCRGLLWWCAYDQNHLTHPPYDWNGHERELGLFRSDRSPKPIAGIMSDFMHRLGESGITRLPEAKREGVCILSEGQDYWGTAFSAFILAKQAGFDIEFQYADQPLKDSKLYLVPSITGARYFDIRFYEKLIEKVRDGATLYLSYDGAFLSPFAEVFGVRVESRYENTGVVQFVLDGATITCGESTHLDLSAIDAEVISSDSSGNPVFTMNRLGNGRAYFLSVPLERHAATNNGAFVDSANPLETVYAAISERERALRAVECDDPYIGLTEHVVSADTRIVVGVNNSPEKRDAWLDVVAGWRVEAIMIGSIGTSAIDEGRYCFEPNDCIVFKLTLSIESS